MSRRNRPVWSSREEPSMRTSALPILILPLLTPSPTAYAEGAWPADDIALVFGALPTLGFLNSGLVPTDIILRAQNRTMHPGWAGIEMLSGVGQLVSSAATYAWLQSRLPTTQNAFGLSLMAGFGAFGAQQFAHGLASLNPPPSGKDRAFEISLVAMSGALLVEAGLLVALRAQIDSQRNTIIADNNPSHTFRLRNLGEMAQASETLAWSLGPDSVGLSLGGRF